MSGTPNHIVSRLIHRGGYFMNVSDESYIRWMPIIFDHIRRCKLCDGKFDKSNTEPLISMVL